MTCNSCGCWYERGPKTLEYRIVIKRTLEDTTWHAEVKRFGIWWHIIGPTGCYGWYGNNMVSGLESAQRDIDWHRARRAFVNQTVYLKG